LPPERLDPTARHHIIALVSSEYDLGRLLREQDDPACVDHYQAAYDLSKKIGHTVNQAVAASSLGNAYLFVSKLRDLDQAQSWHQRDLDLKPGHDRIGRAAAHGSLANVTYQRFVDAQAQGAPETELLAYLNTAHAGYQRALELLPADHHDYRATAHNQLGLISAVVGDIPQALHHYQQAIQHEEARGDTYGAGQTRYNIALLLNQAGRPGDALHYAHAALNNYRDIGPGATTETQQAQTLINNLEQAIEQGTSNK
ncbi:MAG: tetratricopeptide repeat protein, partial [Actinobacteria bacterium]|nr:tetratricopeptide repeat protein [Actinomycetota bacterium]